MNWHYIYFVFRSEMRCVVLLVHVVDKNGEHVSVQHLCSTIKTTRRQAGVKGYKPSLRAHSAHLHRNGSKVNLSPLFS